MGEIRDLLLAKGYIKSSDRDKLWENWILSGSIIQHKVMLSKLANSIMFYELNPKGSPLSYTEFHNVTHPRQIRRLSMFLDFPLEDVGV